MRTKEEILNEARKGHPAPGSWDSTASLNERLTIEALLDIRDILAADVTGRIAVLQDMVRHKGGEH